MNSQDEKLIEKISEWAELIGINLNFEWISNEN